MVFGVEYVDGKRTILSFLAASRKRYVIVEYYSRVYLKCNYVRKCHCIAFLDRGNETQL